MSILTPDYTSAAQKKYKVTLKCQKKVYNVLTWITVKYTYKTSSKSAAQNLALRAAAAVNLQNCRVTGTAEVR